MIPYPTTKIRANRSDIYKSYEITIRKKKKREGKNEQGGKRKDKKITAGNYT